MNKHESTLALGTENVWSLLLKFAIPSIVAMTATSLYNLTDSIFIGQGVGALAISGLAIAFPLMNLGAALASLVGVGSAVLMSMCLGKKDYSTANRILGNLFILNSISGMVFTILTLSFLDPILYFFGASDHSLSYAHNYMQIILLGNLVTLLYFGLNALLRSIGKPKKAMTITLLSIAINIVLTPVFIFGLNLGIKGAAMATVLSQTAMLVWQVRIFCNRNNVVHLQKSSFVLKRKIVFDSLSIGISPFLMTVVASFVVTIVNQNLIRHGGDYALGASGIINRVKFLFTMIVIGLNQGMQPIAGYNFGAHKMNRVKQVLTYTVLLATGAMSLGFLVGEFLPGIVASIFTSDIELIANSISGLRIVFITFPIIGFQMVASNYFQCIGKSKKAIYLSLTRQFLFFLPCLLIMQSVWGLNGVWISIPVSDFLASLNAGYLLFREFQVTKISNSNKMRIC